MTDWVSPLDNEPFDLRRSGPSTKSLLRALFLKQPSRIIKNENMDYTVMLFHDRKDRAYNVSVPALPGCLTWGRTQREALSHAKEAIEGYLEVLRESGDPIPKEAGLHRVRVG